MRDHAAIVEGYHLNKRHWITVTLNADVPDAACVDLIRGQLRPGHAALALHCPGWWPTVPAMKTPRNPETMHRRSRRTPTRSRSPARSGCS